MAETTDLEEKAKSSRIERIRKTISLRGHFVGWMLAPLVGIIFFPSVLLLFFCMLPTVVTYIVEKNYEKHATRTIGYINLAATFGLGWQLWTTDNSIQGALDILNDYLSLTLVYLSAFLGWVIFYLSRSVIDTYLQIAYEIRIRSARYRQLQLAKEWGPEVGEGTEELYKQSEKGTEQIDQDIQKFISESDKKSGRINRAVKNVMRRLFNLENRVAEVAKTETLNLVRQQQEESQQQNRHEFELNRKKIISKTNSLSSANEPNEQK